MSSYLIFDGDCPICSRYAKFTKLRNAVDGLRLIDARDGGPEVDHARRKGFELDQGMVLRLGDSYFHGAEVLHRPAPLSSRSDLFNQMNYFLFESPPFSRISYPLLRTGRNLLLRSLGREKLDF